MSSPASARDLDRGGSFLLALAGSGPIPAEHVAVVVAHPDDETIGIGAQLPRLQGVTVVHVTDGAPRNMADARAKGFATRKDYAEARRREAEAAMALTDIEPSALLGLGIADQEAPFHLVEIVERLGVFLKERRIEVVITHAYEGGHPDHDAVAFAAHGAAGMVAQQGRAICMIEMPLYRAGPEGWLVQSFVPADETPALTIWLGEAERDLKTRMLAAHATQQQTLEAFKPGLERFRRAPGYDFTVLPNQGQLLYERFDWGLTGERWLELTRTALADLRLMERL